MIPNGYWMIDQIPEEMQKKVCFSTFPENKLIGSPETFGWAVVSTYSEKVKKGAVEFLKFRTKLNKEQKEELLNSRTSTGRSELLDDYLNGLYGKSTDRTELSGEVEFPAAGRDVLGECLAELAQGKMRRRSRLPMKVSGRQKTKASGSLKKNNNTDMFFCISGCFIDTGFERISVNIMTTRETKVSKRKAREMNYENA